MNDEVIIQSVVAMLPQMMKGKGYRAETCILSTRIGMAVLEYFGVSARPRAVSVMVFNAEGWKLYWEAMKAGSAPDWGSHPTAWSVGVGGSGVSTWDPVQQRTKWDGHLVIETSDVLVDLTLDQAERPERGIFAGPTVLPLHSEWHTEGTLLLENPHGNILLYQAIDDLNWRQAPDWKQYDKRIAGDLIRIISKIKTLSEATT